MAGPDRDDPPARYLFRVTVRLDPVPGYSAEPDTFETVLSKAAAPPGEDGWLFFRDTLWRGNVGDDAHGRRLAADALGVPVQSVSFSELRTTEAYLDDLKAAIAADLDAFNADSVTEVLTKYLGSSIHVE
ncbi:LWR-salt protein [Haloarcula onubensis]|uniref:LWR-salt protein n=1 Tax=Haloarcula onubensis TaxID=2950539 RepID=A0ABU2FTL3_9EURY|nr:LWR-salt protein [Halomicroarcula sp. S3CR25-11]MDS0283586.1 LWR-salt protein [Halomicroarcula sp. S3CR25-11]